MSIEKLIAAADPELPDEAAKPPPGRPRRQGPKAEKPKKIDGKFAYEVAAKPGGRMPVPPPIRRAPSADR